MKHRRDKRPKKKPKAAHSATNAAKSRVVTDPDERLGQRSDRGVTIVEEHPDTNAFQFHGVADEHGVVTIHVTFDHLEHPDFASDTPGAGPRRCGD